MSDARETDANCSFQGNIHVKFSEKISRCCRHLTKVKFSLHIVHKVTYSNNKAKNNDFKMRNKMVTKSANVVSREIGRYEDILYFLYLLMSPMRRLVCYFKSDTFHYRSL